MGSEMCIRDSYMWFKPTVASKKVPESELQAAIENAKAAGGAWDYDRWGFTKDGYEFYDLYCTEYCGDNHSEMQTVVVVHETLEDLNDWIEEYSKRNPDTTEPAAYGETLYQQRGCKGCHSLDGTKIVGPSFKESYGNQRSFVNADPMIADENYIRESILYPKAKIVVGHQPVMPSYKGQLSDDDIYCLIEYLKTVSDYTPAAETPSDAESETGAEESPKETDQESAAE